MTLEVDKARDVLGRSLGAWVTSPEMVMEVHEGYWYFLSGVPSPAVNMALVYTDEPKALTETLRAIKKKDVPAVLFLAGKARDNPLGPSDSWNRISDFTVMFKELMADNRDPDPRVTECSAEDVAAVAKLLEESFQVPTDTFGFLCESSLNPNTALTTWLLKVGGQAVSTVTTVSVEETVAIWCMGTPPEFARQGYGRELLADVLTRCAKDGAKVGVLSASEIGKTLYDNMGWQVLEEWEVNVLHGIKEE